MTDAAAFQATIHGLRTVPSRGVVQVIVEAPIEALPKIAGIAEHGAWVAVARLQHPKGGADQSPAQQSRSPSDKPAGGAKRSWHEMSPAQQAGIMCNDPVFWRFLYEDKRYAVRNADEAAQAVRELIGVGTRKDIQPDNQSWQSMVSRFQAWKLVA